MGSGLVAFRLVGWGHGSDGQQSRPAGPAGDRARKRLGSRVPGDGLRDGAGAVRCHLAARPGRRIRPLACPPADRRASPGCPTAASATDPGAVRLRRPDLGRRPPIRHPQPRPHGGVRRAGRRTGAAGHRPGGDRGPAAAGRAAVVRGAGHRPCRRRGRPGARAAPRARRRGRRARGPGEPGRRASQRFQRLLSPACAHCGSGSPGRRSFAGCGRCATAGSRGTCCARPWAPGEVFGHRGPPPVR